MQPGIVLRAHARRSISDDELLLRAIGSAYTDLYLFTPTQVSAMTRSSEEDGVLTKALVPPDVAQDASPLVYGQLWHEGRDAFTLVVVGYADDRTSDESSRLAFLKAQALGSLGAGSCAR